MPAGIGGEARSQPGGVAVLVVGLTGGIASGKSTAAAALEAAGAPVVRSDTLAREVVRPGSAALERIAATFGPQLLRADGTLERTALGRMIFADPAARRRLEEITHPEIRRLTFVWLAQQRRRGARAAVCDIPLLFEVGLDGPGSFIDRIWVIAVQPETQLRRLQARDGLPRAAALARIQAQRPLAEKVAGAGRVFWNEGAPEVLAGAVRTAWAELLAEVGGAGA